MAKLTIDADLTDLAAGTATVSLSVTDSAGTTVSTTGSVDIPATSNTPSVTVTSATVQ